MKIDWLHLLHECYKRRDVDNFRVVTSKYLGSRSFVPSVPVPIVLHQLSVAAQGKDVLKESVRQKEIRVLVREK